MDSSRSLPTPLLIHHSSTLWTNRSFTEILALSCAIYFRPLTSGFLAGGLHSSRPQRGKDVRGVTLSSTPPRTSCMDTAYLYLVCVHQVIWPQAAISHKNPCSLTPYPRGMGRINGPCLDVERPVRKKVSGPTVLTHDDLRELPSSRLPLCGSDCRARGFFGERCYEHPTSRDTRQVSRHIGLLLVTTCDARLREWRHCEV